MSLVLEEEAEILERENLVVLPLMKVGLEGRKNVWAGVNGRMKPSTINKVL